MSPKLVQKPEREYDYVAWLVDGTSFKFRAKLRLAWATAEKLAFGAVVQRIETRSGREYHVEERGHE